MRRGDWAWPLGFFALGALEMAAMSRGVGTLDARRIGTVSATGGIALEATASALLILRRRFPLTVAMAVSFLCSLMPVLGIHMDEPVTPILLMGLAMFAAGRYRVDRWAYGAPLVAFVSPFVAKWLDHPGVVDLTDALFILLILSAPFAFGRLALRQAERHAREEARVRTEAMAAERVRIARELHDVLAHSISSMVLRANVGADLAAGTRSAEVFGQIADTGRGALEDVGHLLRLLRTSDEADVPAPTSADIPALVAKFRRDGLHVEAEEVTVTSLGTAADLSVYRIVQEALTNALKHSGQGRASVRVVETDPGIAIEVTSGASTGQDSAGGGHGLIGMRERVEMLGGTLHTGPGPDGGYEVRVLIPREIPT